MNAPSVISCCFPLLEQVPVSQRWNQESLQCIDLMHPITHPVKMESHLKARVAFVTGTFLVDQTTTITYQILASGIVLCAKTASHNNACVLRPLKYHTCPHVYVAHSTAYPYQIWYKQVAIAIRSWVESSISRSCNATGHHERMRSLRQGLRQQLDLAGTVAWLLAMLMMLKLWLMMLNQGLFWFMLVTAVVVNYMIIHMVNEQPLVDGRVLSSRLQEGDTNQLSDVVGSSRCNKKI